MVEWRRLVKGSSGNHPIDILVVGRSLSEHLRVPNIKLTLINLCKLGVSLMSERVNVYMMSYSDTHQPETKQHFQASGTWTFIDINADMNAKNFLSSHPVIHGLLFDVVLFDFSVVKFCTNVLVTVTELHRHLAWQGCILLRDVHLPEDPALAYNEINNLYSAQSNSITLRVTLPNNDKHDLSVPSAINKQQLERFLCASKGSPFNFDGLASLHVHNDHPYTDGQRIQASHRMLGVHWLSSVDYNKLKTLFHIIEFRAVYPMPSTVNIIMDEEGKQEFFLMLSLHALAISRQDCENLKLIKQLNVTEEVYREEDIFGSDSE